MALAAGAVSSEASVETGAGEVSSAVGVVLVKPIGAGAVSAMEEAPGAVVIGPMAVTGAGVTTDGPVPTGELSLC